DQAPVVSVSLEAEPAAPKQVMFHPAKAGPLREAHRRRPVGDGGDLGARHATPKPWEGLTGRTTAEAGAR
ncbi:MAG TPA: hypothetical protein VLN08_03995, partial [Vicinamibacterales bacterium]|nr:hypothetical protein [Vicinamibacterales bacterium]